MFQLYVGFGIEFMIFYEINILDTLSIVKRLLVFYIFPFFICILLKILKITYSSVSSSSKKGI